jgi:hypothetical protein
LTVTIRSKVGIDDLRWFSRVLEKASDDYLFVTASE